MTTDKIEIPKVIKDCIAAMNSHEEKACSNNFGNDVLVNDLAGKLLEKTQ